MQIPDHDASAYTGLAKPDNPHLTVSESNRQARLRVMKIIARDLKAPKP